MLDTVMAWVTREALPLFLQRGVWPTSDIKQGSQTAGRESDHCVVPMRRGNARRREGGDTFIALTRETYASRRGGKDVWQQHWKG
jgi:hypothetical protein